MTKQAFKLDIEAIRDRARNKMAQGPVTGAYHADVHRVVEVLNEVLATEMVCYLRYTHHYHSATGIHAPFVADEFKEHAREELGHAEQVAERIAQLKGIPDFNPATLMSRSHAEYTSGETLVDLIKEDLVAERVAIETYSEVIRWLGEDDPTTRRMMEEILEKEEEHADDLVRLLERMDIGSLKQAGKAA